MKRLDWAARNLEDGRSVARLSEVEVEKLRERFGDRLHVGEDSVPGKFRATLADPDARNREEPDGDLFTAD